MEVKMDDLVVLSIREERKEEFLFTHVRRKHPKYPPDINNLTWILPMWLFMWEFHQYYREIYPIKKDICFLGKEPQKVNLNDNVRVYLTLSEMEKSDSKEAEKLMKLSEAVRQFGGRCFGDVASIPVRMLEII